MILLNVLITIIITALVGFIVVQGLLSNALGDTVNVLSDKSADANILINLSITGIRSERTPEEELRAGAQFFTAKISENNSVTAVIFDVSGSVIGQSDELSEYSVYAQSARKVAEQNRNAYIYSRIDRQNYILFFSPLTASGNVCGVLMLIQKVSSADELSSSTVRLFLIAGLIGAIASLILYTISHNALTKPLRQLAAYFVRRSEGSDEAVPEIDRDRNDAVDIFLRAYEDMQENIDDKIAELDMERTNSENMVAAMQDAVFSVSASGEMLIKNARADEILRGRRADELIPDLFGIVQSTIETDRPSVSEIMADEKNYLVTAVPVKRTAGDTAVMFVTSDITAVRQSEAEQNRFISSVSHELKTPLTTIIGYANLLKRRGTADEAVTEKALDTIDSESRRLVRLVEDLLQIGRMNSYEFDLVLSDVDLNTLLGQVSSDMNVEAAEKNVAVLYESTPIPAVWGDADRLRQCFINIIDNAVKYSESGGVVRVTAVSLDGWAEISVRDYAGGIPEDKRSKVFEPFYRVEDDRRRVTGEGGYGLGLSIVKNIILRHNGTVTIDSEKDYGTLVTVRLPEKKEEKNE